MPFQLGWGYVRCPAFKGLDSYRIVQHVLLLDERPIVHARSVDLLEEVALHLRLPLCAGVVVGIDGGPLQLCACLCELVVLVYDILVKRVILPYVCLGHGWSKLQARDAVEPSEVVDKLRPPMGLRYVTGPIGPVSPLQHAHTMIMGPVGVPVPSLSINPSTQTS